MQWCRDGDAPVFEDEGRQPGETLMEEACRGGVAEGVAGACSDLLLVCFL